MQYFKHTEICKWLKKTEAVWLKVKLILPTHCLFWLLTELHSYRENFPYLRKVLKNNTKIALATFLV